MTGGETFRSGGIRIAYDDVGAGRPVVLLHGYGSDRHRDWFDRGWLEALRDAGRRVVALDQRGHGESDKPHEADAYGNEVLARDVVRLLDHLSIAEADVVGYSMGGRVATRLLLDHGERVTAAVLAGVGANVLGPSDRRPVVADAMESDDPASIPPRIRRFRETAARRGNDLRALAACERAEVDGIDLDGLAAVETPTLVAAGEADDVVEDARGVAESIPRARFVAVPECGHGSTLSADELKAAALSFLDREGRS